MASFFLSRISESFFPSIYFFTLSLFCTCIQKIYTLTLFTRIKNSRNAKNSKCVKWRRTRAHTHARNSMSSVANEWKQMSVSPFMALLLSLRYIVFVVPIFFSLYKYVMFFWTGMRCFSSMFWFFTHNQIQCNSVRCLKFSGELLTRRHLWQQAAKVPKMCRNNGNFIYSDIKWKWRGWRKKNMMKKNKEQ